MIRAFRAYDNGGGREAVAADHIADGLGARAERALI